MKIKQLFIDLAISLLSTLSVNAQMRANVLAPNVLGTQNNMVNLPSVTIPSANMYKFNGKELNPSIGLYDYGARYMDPSIGRFTTMDPLAEMNYSVSPYAYANNNPVNNIDPTGMYIVGTNGKPITYSAQAGWSSNASPDVIRIGNAMMMQSYGRQYLYELINSSYPANIKWNPGFRAETGVGRDVLGYTETRTTGTGTSKRITGVDITLYGGKINKMVANYNDMQGKNPIYANPLSRERDKANVRLNPTVDQMISTVGTHEFIHGVDKNANASFVGDKLSEPPAYNIETKAINELIDQKNWQQYMQSHPVIQPYNPLNTELNF